MRHSCAEVVSFREMVNEKFRAKLIHPHGTEDTNIPRPRTNKEQHCDKLQGYVRPKDFCWSQGKTSYMDDHQFKEEENESVGELSTICYANCPQMSAFWLVLGNLTYHGL